MDTIANKPNRRSSSFDGMEAKDNSSATSAENFCFDGLLGDWGANPRWEEIAPVTVPAATIAQSSSQSHPRPTLPEQPSSNKRLREEPESPPHSTNPPPTVRCRPNPTSPPPAAQILASDLGLFADGVSDITASCESSPSPENQVTNSPSPSNAELVPEDLAKRDGRHWRPHPGLTREEIRRARAQRNRESAKRSRERQKLDRQHAEETLLTHMQENERLRKVVRTLTATINEMRQNLTDVRRRRQQRTKLIEDMLKST